MADELNFQVPPPGFDSYLNGIIPQDQAVTAGAFSVTMQQVRDITKADTPTFSKIVYSLESTKDLPDVNGTDIPTNKPLALTAQEKLSLGSGAYGTYTMSNFFGAMSGLPYPLKNIYENIKNLETTNLKTIYKNLYLAVTWEDPDITWDGSTFTYDSRGGGYGRNNAAAPAVTVGGNPATATIGTNPNDINTYGKIVSIQYSGPAGSVVVDSPPGGGWPAMNAVVQNYIDQANAEIANIKRTSNSQLVKLLNAYWNVTGTALKHEQRARYIAMASVPIPYDRRFSGGATAINVLVDTIPEYALDTEPHMSSQTLEHISDIGTIGGQSIIAMLRQERNQERLSEVGIELDNNLPINFDIDLTKELILNGTVPDAIEGEGIESPCGLGTYTIPANATTRPYNYYDDGLRQVIGCVEGSIEPILNCDPNPIVNECSPAGPGPLPPAPINPFVVDPNVLTIPSPNLNPDYTATTLQPSIYNIDEAIDKVIECNCDCWIK